jgi:limonene-1,2-epoxide hydrolase
LCDASAVPWLPELFSAPVLERVLAERRRENLLAVPYFAGLLSGENRALIGSFAGEPELHHPGFGRVKGVAAFERFVTRATTWVRERNITIENVALVVTPLRSVEEVVLHLDRDDGTRAELPLAVAADRDEQAYLRELRVYYSTWPETDGHLVRTPLLQQDPDVHAAGVVEEYQRALAEGDVEAVVAAFEPDAYVREPAGSAYVHRGTDELRALFTQFFSNGGGIPLEHCAVTDDGVACALEYNVVAWGSTELAPQAGVAVYVRGESGKLAAARIYDDVDPPL